MFFFCFFFVCLPAGVCTHVTARYGTVMPGLDQAAGAELAGGDAYKVYFFFRINEKKRRGKERKKQGVCRCRPNGLSGCPLRLARGWDWMRLTLSR